MKLIDKNKCFFCDKESAQRIALTVDNSLDRQYKFVPYNGVRYPVCHECGEFWSREYLKIDARFCAEVDALFKRLVETKGGVNEQGKSQ